MMSDLVGDDVGLREITRRVEAALQLVVKGEIDINLLVERAIEWPHLSLADAACGARTALENDELGFLVVLAEGLEDAVPDGLGIGEHAADKHLHLVAGRGGLAALAGKARNVGAALAFGGLLARHFNLRELATATTAGQNVERVDAEQQHNRADDEERREAHAAAATHGNLDAARSAKSAAALAAAILNIAAFLIFFVVAHRCLCGVGPWAFRLSIL